MWVEQLRPRAAAMLPGVRPSRLDAPPALQRYDRSAAVDSSGKLFVGGA